MSAQPSGPAAVFTFGVPDFTGANRMAFEYLLALKRAGVPVAAACGTWSGASGSVIQALEENGIPVRIFDGWEKLMDVGLARELAGFLKENHAGVVISFLQLDVKIAGWAANWAGIPFVPCAQNAVTFGGNRVLRWIKTLVYRQTLLRCAPFTYCCSESVMQEYKTRFGIPARKLRLLPNRIDTGRFGAVSEENRNTIRKGLGVVDDERLVLNVGRIDAQKGQDLLLEAVTGGIDGARFALIGGESAVDPGGIFFQRINRLAAGSSGVTLAGWRDDIPQVLASGDLYVHPSRWEGLPLAVLEAMAAGLAVIYSDCAGSIEGFEDGVHGYCVPVGNVKALRNALLDLLGRSAEDLSRMGNAGRKLVVEKHDFKLSADQFCSDIQNLIKAPH